MSKRELQSIIRDIKDHTNQVVMNDIDSELPVEAKTAIKVLKEVYADA